MDDKYWFLKRCDLFAQLSDPQMRSLELASQIKTFDRRSLVYLPDDQSDSLLLVLTGRVRIYHLTGEGKEALLAFVDPGEIFGELAVVGQARREEFAETMEKSQLLKIPRSAVETLLQQVPSVSLGFTRLIGLRRQTFERRLKSLMFQPNRERLIHLLLELAGKYGEPHPQGTALKLKLSHQEMANLIGSTRETVTVVLGELQLQKLVVIERRRVILRDPKSLAQSAGIRLPESQE